MIGTTRSSQTSPTSAAGAPSRPFVRFVPFAWRFAARLASVSQAEMDRDPTVAVHALRVLQRLVGLDVVVAGPRPPATRADPAAPTCASAVEAARRLVVESNGRFEVFGAVAGPRTLAWPHPVREQATEALMAIAREYFEAGVHGLAVVETAPAVDGGDTRSPRALSSLSNVAGYFGVPAILVDAVSGSGGLDVVISDGDGTVSTELLGLAPSPSTIAAIRPAAGFVLTADEVPPQTSIDELKAWARAIRELSRRAAGGTNA